MANKMTNLDRINHIISLVGNDAIALEYLNAQKESLAKRSAKAKSNPARDALTQAVYDAMIVGKPYRAKEVMMFPCFGTDTSSPKATYHLDALVKQKLIIRTEDKNVAYFTKIEAPTAE